MTDYINPSELPIEGPLSTCLDVAGDMLAATATWQALCVGDADGGRGRIHVAEIPKKPGSGIHSPPDIGGGLPYAIVHFDDEGTAASFSYRATGNFYLSSQTIIARLYLSPPSNIDPDDINLVERWVLNTVGRIVRGADADTSPGLLDLSHRGDMLMIRQLDVLGPAYPSLEQQTADRLLYVAVELVLQIGVNG